jgi:hypothetical protein
MRRNGRPEDQDFSAEEKLYRRCSRRGIEEIVGVKRLTPLSIPFPDLSVNREKYGGQPGDVLIPDWPAWGIASWMVEDVPSPLSGTTGTEFSFRVVHVPEEENFYHSEIRTFRGGVRFLKKPPDHVKQEFRMRLSARTRVIVEPSE